jgi:O-antigen ligase
MLNILRALPFLALFPGYFAYHWSAINGWTPLYLGGYVNEISTAILIGLVFVVGVRFMLASKAPMGWSSVDTAFSLFMVWFLMVVMVHAILTTAPEVTKNHIASIIQLAGAYIALRVYPQQHGRWALLVVTVLFSLSVLQAAEQDILGLLFRTTQGTGYTTYQGLARAYLMTAAFALMFLPVALLRWAGYAGVTFVLFLLGARSEIIGAVILFALFEIAMSRRPLRALLITSVTIAAIGLVLFSLIDWIEYLFPDNRLLTLVLKQTGDASVEERALQQALAWDTVLGKPILGDYGHYAKELSAGAYAHNWVSVWVDLGIIGLLLFLFLYGAVFRSGLAIYRASLNIRADVLRVFASVGLGLLVMTAAFSLFAKTFTDPGLAAVAGLFAGLYAHLSRRTRPLEPREPGP